MLWLCKQICTTSLRPHAQGQLGGGCCCICLELVSRSFWHHKIRFTCTQTQRRWATQGWMVVNSEDKHREKWHWSRCCYYFTGEQESVCSAVRIKLTTSYILQLLPVVGRKHKGSLSIMDEDRCRGLLFVDNPCVWESPQPHYPSIDFSSTPTKQDCFE